MFTRRKRYLILKKSAKISVCLHPLNPRYYLSTLAYVVFKERGFGGCLRQTRTKTDFLILYQKNLELLQDEVFYLFHKNTNN